MAASAKFAPPFPHHTILAQPAVERCVGAATLFSAPAGFLSSDHFVGMFENDQRNLLWMRAGLEDCDPATLLMSLAAGLDERFPGVSARTLERMRRQPGPVFGWGQLYASLAGDLCDVLPANPTASISSQNAPLALVIEHVDLFNPAPQTLALLWEHFLSLLPPRLNQYPYPAQHTFSQPAAWVCSPGWLARFASERSCLPGPGP